MADAKNEAEQAIFAAEGAIRDLGDKLSDDEKTTVEDLIKDVKEVLEKEDASLDDIKDKTSKLQEKAMELAGKVYESAAKANESTDDNSSDSDVEEAEFVDKK